jgi:hypothetical protein
VLEASPATNTLLSEEMIDLEEDRDGEADWDFGFGFGAARVAARFT